VLNSFTELGLEHIVGGAHAWVNVSREFVVGGLARAVPPSSVVLELLEDQAVDDELIEAIDELREDRYRVALDDFDFDANADRLLDHVDIVKLDLLALGRERFAEKVARLAPRELRLVAEKLESHEDYQFCLDLGCDLFQGYFFCKPEIVTGRRIDGNSIALLEVISALQNPRIRLEELQRMIANDVALSNRLLRYINSAYFGLRQQVRSINQAMALLGIENLKRWASLSVFSSLGDKPTELTVTALIRARFCELAGERRRRSASSAELFTLGLFSVIDALMDTPIDELLEQLPFPDDMCAALASHDGDDGRLLRCVILIEQGDFVGAEALVPDAGALYMEALGWANRASVLI
jgi:EAL and modified HD-GYP domain-containing signal transduction protein